MQTQIQLAQSQAEEANESKELSAREFELMRQRWKVEIDSKSREFEDLQKRLLAPSVTEELRIKMLEELDETGEMKKTIQAMEVHGPPHLPNPNPNTSPNLSPNLNPKPKPKP